MTLKEGSYGFLRGLKKGSLAALPASPAMRLDGRLGGRVCVRNGTVPGSYVLCEFLLIIISLIVFDEYVTYERRGHGFFGLAQNGIREANLRASACICGQLYYMDSRFRGNDREERE
jgi:hypothetical protein